jgi:hypothetical protein
LLAHPDGTNSVNLYIRKLKGQILLEACDQIENGQVVVRKRGQDDDFWSWLNRQKKMMYILYYITFTSKILEARYENHNVVSLTVTYSQ